MALSHLLTTVNKLHQTEFNLNKKRLAMFCKPYKVFILEYPRTLYWLAIILVGSPLFRINLISVRLPVVS